MPLSEWSHYKSLINTKRPNGELACICPMFCQAIISDLTETNKGFLARANRFSVRHKLLDVFRIKRENVAVTICGSFSSAILTRKVIEGEKEQWEKEKGRRVWHLLQSGFLSGTWDVCGERRTSAYDWRREGEGVEGWKEKDDTEWCKISLRGEREGLSYCLSSTSYVSLFPSVYTLEQGWELK